MDIALGVWISIVAVLISFASLAISFWQRCGSAITGAKPALVFVFDNAGGWRLRRVGEGPALNVIVAKKRVQGGWFNPVRVPPVPKDGEFDLHWIHGIPADDKNGLGATYNDMRDRPYITTTGGDHPRISEGYRLLERIVPAPHSRFEDDEIRVYRGLPDVRRGERCWGGFD